MRFNETAMAFGLFQVVFADVIDHLAVATFRLRERSETGLVFEDVFGQESKRLLKQFRAELNRFDCRSDVSDEVRELRESCEIISRLRVWRNDRIHARIRMTEGGYALYDWRTRCRLDISCKEIETNIELAVKAIVTLEANVQYLFRELNWDEEFEELFSTVPALSEPPTSDEK